MNPFQCVIVVMVEFEISGSDDFLSINLYNVILFRILLIFSTKIKKKIVKSPKIPVV